MSNRPPSKEESENVVTCVVISMSALGSEFGFAAGAPAWVDGVDELSCCFFLPKRLPSPFTASDDALVGIELFEELPDCVCDGGGFAGGWFCAPFCESVVTGCPLAVAEIVMLT